MKTAAAPQQKVPGPDADRATLLAWYRDVVQTFAATHSYNDFRFRCYWCLATEQKVKAQRGGPSGAVKYCSDHCSKAADAYRTKVLRARAAPSAEPVDPEAESSDTPPAPAFSDEGVSDAARELRAEAVLMGGQFSIQSLADSAHKDWYKVREVLQGNPDVFRPVNSRKWELVA